MPVPPPRSSSTLPLRQLERPEVLRRAATPLPFRSAPGARESRAPGINALDFSIAQNNGYTMAIGLSNIQSSKSNSSVDLRARIEELTREIGYLRQEVKFYRECFSVLQKLREASYDIYQQLFLASHFPIEENKMSELCTQLHKALQESMRREVNAEKDWKLFWGVDMRLDYSMSGYF